jgi:hypothetical protein
MAWPSSASGGLVTGVARRPTRASEGNIVLKRSIAAPADRPLVSVVVPAWNAGRSIERALASVLSDGRADVEAIVVDDGSTDDTVAIVEAIAARDPRVVLLRSPANEGVSSARNRALAAARGEWLTFLDADDRLLPGALAALLGAAHVNDALAVVGQRIWSDGHRTWRTAAYDIPDIRRSGRTSLPGRPGLMYYASATGKLFHRSITEALRFEGRVLGDQPWTIRALIRAGDRIVVIGDDVYEWIRPRDHAASTITAAKRASARLAAEAARVAVGALAEVVAEAEDRIADPVARRRVVAGYFERLVRSDLAGPVRRAAQRDDEDSDELFEAIGAFLDAAPPDLVGASDDVAELLRSPLDRWLHLRGPGRSAYVRLLRSVTAAHPDLAGRIGGRSLIRLAVWILRSTDRRPAEAVATILLVLNWPVGALHRLRRYHPPRILLGRSRGS